MNIRFLVLSVCAVGLLVSLWACAGTTLQNTWKEDGYTGKVSRVMVLGVTNNKAVRQMFESDLSQQLKAKGIDAVPSFPLFSSDKVIDKQLIVDKAHENNVEFVIVAKVLDVQSYNERVTDIQSTGFGGYGGRYRPYGRGGGWYGDYSSGYTTARSYDIEWIVSYVETGLYLLDGEKMVWSALTETETDEDLAASVKGMTTVIVNQLEKDGMI